MIHAYAQYDHQCYIDKSSLEVVNIKIIMSILLIGENSRPSVRPAFRSELVEELKQKKQTQQEYKANLLQQIQEDRHRKYLQAKKQKQLDAYYEQMFYQYAAKNKFSPKSKKLFHKRLPPIDQFQSQIKSPSRVNYSYNPEEVYNKYNQFAPSKNSPSMRIKTEPYERMQQSPNHSHKKYSDQKSYDKKSYVRQLHDRKPIIKNYQRKSHPINTFSRDESFSEFAANIQERKKQLQCQLESKLNEVYKAMSDSIDNFDTNQEWAKIHSKMQKLHMEGNTPNFRKRKVTFENKKENSDWSERYLRHKIDELQKDD